MSTFSPVQAAGMFDIRGIVKNAVPYGSGHINDTYRVTVCQGGTDIDYILQRINHNIFTNVAALMDNIVRVTQHIRGKLLAEDSGADYTKQVLTLIPTLNGESYYRDVDGNYWRMYIFIHGAATYDFVSEPRQAYEAAYNFGRFQCQLTDLPGAPLFETIPNFHNTPSRFQNFLNSLQADVLNRAQDVQQEIAFAMSFQDKIALVTEGLADGSIPLRVTHNDTKINNVMLEDNTGKGICVLDLDTVMPGSVLYDFGDEIRTSTATSAEDEQDLSKVIFRLDMFEALVHGYLDATRDMLTPRERELLPFSGCLITFEIGLRFLTDYLDGDKYFKVHKPGHNIHRCRTQFELVRQMSAIQDKMLDIVAKY